MIKIPLLYLVFILSQCQFVNRFTISEYIFAPRQIKMQIQVIAPLSKGTYPVLLYMTGFAGLIPWYMQTLWLDELAQEGFVMLTISEVAYPNPQKQTEVVSSVIDWINKNLQNRISMHMPGVKADLQNRFGVMGHSAANHILTQYLNQTCGNVKLQILIDPVDGSDPNSTDQKNFITHPGQLLPYATPAIIIETELDHVPKYGLNMACAPEPISNKRFYNAMRGPKWYLNVSKYGHADFFDEQFRLEADIMCSSCKKDCNFGQYRLLLKDIVTKFALGIFNHQKDKIDWIENGLFSIQTQKMFDRRGYSIDKGGFCIMQISQKNEILGLQFQS